MTTLLWTGGALGNHRCDAHCHNATQPRCVCCCNGRYHGKREGSAELRSEVEEHGMDILLDLGAREQRGELEIFFARDPETGKPLISHHGRIRPAQVDLLQGVR